MPGGRRAALALALSLPPLVACGADGPAAAAGEPGGPDTAAWGRALELAYRGGGLDYARLAADPSDLDAYLASLAGATPAAWSADERLAFWTNAYNAVVVRFVLERYPGIASVKDVDGFFDRLTFPVAGEALTLDQIEGRARDVGDPRVHFAVVCASTSCPDLLPEPYDAERLDRQLDGQTRRFLADPRKGMRWDPERKEVWLSSLFKWYAGDFTGGSTVVAYFARGRVLDWVLPFLPESLRREVEAAEPSVRYLDYDWSLNDRP